MKKLLAITLSLLMVFVLIPVATLTASAASITATDEATFKAAFTNTTTDTITLGANIVLTAPLTTAYGETINMAGFTITYNPTDSANAAVPAISVAATKSFTINAFTKTCFVRGANADAAVLFVSAATTKKIIINSEEKMLEADANVLASNLFGTQVLNTYNYWTLIDVTGLSTYVTNGASDRLALNGDITLTSQIKNASGKADSIDLNGYTITYAPTDSQTTDAGIYMAASMYDNSAVVFTNSSADGLGGFVDNAPNACILKTDATQGKVTLGAGTYNGSFSIDNAGSVNPLNIIDKTTVVNASVEATGDVNPCTNGIIMNGEVNVQGTLNTQWFTITFNNNVTATIIKGSAGLTFNKPVVATDYISMTGAASFADTITAKDFYSRNGSYNGKITAENFYAMGGNFAEVSVTKDAVIVGGTFNAMITFGTGKKDIVGGTFSGADYASTFSSQASLKGGVYSFDPTEYLNADATVTENKGIFTVTYNLFEVNGVKYPSATAANVAASDQGDTIKLTDNYYMLNSNYTILNLTKNNITFDLNGYNMTDFSDKCYAGNRKFINCTTDTVTNFTLTDSTYATTGGGSITIQGGSNQGGTEENIRFNALNSVDTPINFLFENVTITTTSSQDNNGGQYLFSGTSTNADNKIVFKNLKQLHTGGASLSSTGYNGMTYSVAAPLTIENSTLECNRNTITLNKEVPITIKNSTITASKFGPINLNAKTDLKIDGSVINANVGGPSGGSAIKVATVAAANSTITANATTFNLDNSNALASGSTTIGAYTAKFNSCEFNLTNTGAAFNLQAAETVTVNNGKFNLNYYNATMATLATNATLTIDKNTIVTGTADTTSSGVNPLFTIKGTSADVISTLNINSMTATNVRNFITSGNAFNKVYIEDMDFTRDSKAGQWNSGWAFASASTNVTLGDGYQVTTYLKGVEAVRENYVWSTGEDNKRIVVSNPNMAFYTVDGLQYKALLNSVVNLPVNSASNFIAYSDGTNYYDSAANVTISTADMAFTTVGLDLSMSHGAAIRYNTPTGMRFYTNIDKTQINSLKAKGATVSLGTLIAPKDLIGSADLTKSAEFKKLDVAFQSDEWYTEGNFNGVVGSIASIQDKNLNREFVGRGYATVTLGSITKTVYADYANSNISNNSRTVCWIANQIKNGSEYNTLSTEKKTIVDGFASSYVAQ